MWVVLALALNIMLPNVIEIICAVRKINLNDLDYML